MPRLGTPEDLTDTLVLADWLELTALASKEHAASFGSLERMLKRAGIYEKPDGRNIEQDARVEKACADVELEIRRRVKAAAAAYPFTMDSNRLLLRGAAADYPAYVFCLCLSWFGWTPRKGTKTFPRRMFEDLATHAAASYVGGRALRFGSPRTSLPTKFLAALETVCLQMGEGQLKAGLQAKNAKDDTLDIVAWREFPDERIGKLLMMGQCASGRNYASKKTELNPYTFFSDWLSDHPASPITKAFFIPHHIRPDKWQHYVRSSGIVFDRSRIAHYSQDATFFLNSGGYVEWSARTLDRVTVS
jgi:hypothetical protein